MSLPQDSFPKIPGLGPKRTTTLNEHGIHNLNQLLHCLPQITFFDAGQDNNSSTWESGKRYQFYGRVINKSQRFIPRRGRQSIITLQDPHNEHRFCKLLFFGKISTRHIEEQKTYLFEGKAGKGSKQWPFQLIHPKTLSLKTNAKQPQQSCIREYPSIERLPLVSLIQKIFDILPHDQLNNLVEDPLNEFSSHDYLHHLQSIHIGDNSNNITQALKVLDKRRYLHWIECQKIDQTAVYSFGHKTLKYALNCPLPFALSKSQEHALNEITENFSKTTAQQHLLHGDVGSGKTAVFLSLCNALAQEHQQSLIIAPTILLSEQIYAEAQRIHEENDNFRCAQLHANLNGIERQKLFRKWQNNSIDCIISAHTAFSHSKEFSQKPPALIVFDEQQRFGISQRLTLQQANSEKHPHCLLVSATPLPRLLAELYNNFCAISKLSNDNRNVQIQTKITRKKTQDLLKNIHLKTLIICPRIHSNNDDIANIHELKQLILNDPILRKKRLCVLHSELNEEEFIKAKKDLSTHNYDIIISSSIIEVGISLPDLEQLIILGAQQFGLAQLHQFRGRLYRGIGQKHCILQYTSTHVPPRLQACVDYDDGFQLSEEDLRLRGASEPLSFQQHGLPDISLESWQEISKHKKVFYTLAKKQRKSLLRCFPQTR